MPVRQLAQVSVGDVVGPVTVPVVRETLVAYANASLDQNPIHQDEAFARSVGLPDVIAHGMWTMGASGTVVADWADKDYIEDSATVSRVSYSTGSIFNGGAQLRIRTRDERIPENEGSAHLTMRLNGRFVNKLLSCSIY